MIAEKPYTICEFVKLRVFAFSLFCAVSGFIHPKTVRDKGGSVRRGGLSEEDTFHMSCLTDVEGYETRSSSTHALTGAPRTKSTYPVAFQEEGEASPMAEEDNSRRIRGEIASHAVCLGSGGDREVVGGGIK